MVRSRARAQRGYRGVQFAGATEKLGTRTHAATGQHHEKMHGAYDKDAHRTQARADTHEQGVTGNLDGMHAREYYMYTKKDCSHADRPADTNSHAGSIADYLGTRHRAPAPAAKPLDRCADVQASAVLLRNA